MKRKTGLTRRAALGVIGALGASVVPAYAGDTTANAIVGRDTIPGSSDLGTACSRDLNFPHTSSTVVDTVTPLAVAALTNDLDNILPTLSSWDSHYAVLSAQADGAFTLRTAFTPEEVRGYYAANVAGFTYLDGEERFYDHQGRWFSVVDSKFNLYMLPNGPLFSGMRGVHVVLTWPDGVIGQLYWGEPSWVRPFDVRDPKEFTEKLGLYENAWRSGDVEARLAMIEDQTCSVARVAELAGTRRSRFIARTKDELRAAWSDSTAGQVLELDRLHHIVSTYYVLAVHRVVLKVDREKTVREVVTLFPIGPTRKFIGELSYAFEA